MISFSSSEDIVLSNPLKDDALSQQPHQISSLLSEKSSSSFYPADHQDFKDSGTGPDYWWYEIGCNVIPVDSKNKIPALPWKEWQNNPISDDQYEAWKNSDVFRTGIAVITGRLWRGPYKHKYLVCIDCDNKKGIDELLFHCFPWAKTLDELSEKTIVEQHPDNRDKAHVYLVVEKPLTNRGSINGIGRRDESVPIIEVKSEGKSYMVCSPSIHKDGFNYEIIGTKTPTVLDREQSEVLEESIKQIHKKYGVSTDETNNGLIPIEDLFKDDFIAHEGSRHLQLLRGMETVLLKNKNGMLLEQIKAQAKEWNQKHCLPPLDDKEFERQWMCALEFIKRNNSSFLPIASTSTLITKKINDSPPIFYYADPVAKIIGRFKKIKGEGKNPEETMEKIVYTNIIIDAVPKKIYLYKPNPLLKSSPDRIKIVFKSSICKDFEIGPYVNVEMIVKDLENKHLILNVKNKTEALSCIINAYKEKNLVEELDGITTEGYYLIDGKIRVIGSVQSITSELDIDKGKKCAEFLDLLANSGWKNKNIFPTVLKWGIVAPFSFSIKYNSDNWIPWLLLYGKGQSGKTTLGKIVMHIWNLDERERSKGFTNIDSIARFGHTISKDTYPIVMNEVGSLSTNNFGKYSSIIEAMKHSIESRVCRGTHIERRYHEILALSPLILTSNYAPPNDGSFNRRLTNIHFPEEEKKDAEETATFNKLLEKNKRYLSVLGDFATSYIIDNPSKLLDSTWQDLAKEILCRFYELMGSTNPDWIENFEEQRDAIDESSEKTHFDLRAFLLNTINDTYTRNKRFDHSEIEPDVYSKLDYCLRNNLISFLSMSKDDTLIITRDIMTRLREKNSIENIASLKDVGSQINFIYTYRYLDRRKMRVLEGKREDFNSFINPEVH
jgi:hypothetical protein